MWKSTLIVMLCICSPILLSCGADGDSIVDGVDDEGAQQKVEEANEALANILYDLINLGDIDDPQDIDFSLPNSLYREALELDGDNLDANFGAGLTELLMITVDPEVNAAYDTWKAFLDTASFFEPPGGLFRMNFQSPEEMFYLSPMFLGVYSAGIFNLALSDPPMISSIQDIVESEVIPRVDYAITKLYIVSDDPHYTFIITPHMQGDNTEDPIEIDLTEIYVALTQLHLLKAIGNMFTSYNFDFVSYDSIGLEEAIDQNSSFLGLRADGALNMANAKGSFLAAVNRLEDAIIFLESEEDSQDDDLIRIGPDGIDGADLDSVQAYLQDARDAMNSTVEITEDFDGDGEDETVTFALGAIFDNPVQNFKGLLPPYSSYVQRDSSYWDYFYTGVITWEASSYSEWIFPDPTFNGFLPGMTDAQFKSTFGIYPSDWERVVRIEFR